MPKCYQLVGVPCSGKSTWAANQNWARTCAVISTDEFVEEYAKSVGKTYAQVFNEYMPTAVELMCQKVVEAREQGRDIIWDQTSTTVKSRKKKFNMLPNYEHIAVVFKTPEHKELYRRLNNRPGKDIPDNVISSMIDNFEPPTLKEGFRDIWFTS